MKQTLYQLSEVKQRDDHTTPYIECFRLRVLVPFVSSQKPIDDCFGNLPMYDVPSCKLSINNMGDVVSG